MPVALVGALARLPVLGLREGDRPAPVATVQGYEMFSTGCRLSLQSQPDGFSGVDCSGHARNLVTWDRDGRILHSYAVDNGTDNGDAYFAIDPSGGTVAIHEYIRNGLWYLWYQRYDKHGLLETQQALGEGAFLMSGSFHTADGYPGPRIDGLGVNLAGRTLFIVSNVDPTGKRYAMWVDRDGTHHDLFETTVVPQNTGDMQFLADGRLALRENGWQWAWPDLATAPEEVPAWLGAQQHRYGEYFTIRGGRGYAVNDSVAGSVDLYAASGKLCGQIPVQVYRGSWAVGRDGTLIVGASNGARSRWWPQLLK